jgi:hypothetical protein
MRSVERALNGRAIVRQNQYNEEQQAAYDAEARRRQQLAAEIAALNPTLESGAVQFE